MQTSRESLPMRFAAWCVHAFTASGAIVGVFALAAIYHHQLLPAFWLMGVAVLIDAVDGMFARLVNVKKITPTVNGELLDNIVDFVNYTIVPVFFILMTSLVPSSWRVFCVVVITFSSAFQFTQVDAKTADHFFKGFPSYWNIAIFYLFFWQMSEYLNLIILMILALLSFVPIKYIYPSRLEFLSSHGFVRASMLMATLCWGVATGALMWLYPESHPLLTWISMGYIILYVMMSLYRTWKPLSVRDSL